VIAQLHATADIGVADELEQRPIKLNRLDRMKLWRAQGVLKLDQSGRAAADLNIVQRGVCVYDMTAQFCARL
jgi:hypothetical protein